MEGWAWMEGRAVEAREWFGVTLPVCWALLCSSMSGVLGSVKKGSAEIQGEQKPTEGVAPASRGTSGVTVSADPSAALDLLGGPQEEAAPLARAHAAVPGCGRCP